MECYRDPSHPLDHIVCVDLAAVPQKEKSAAAYKIIQIDVLVKMAIKLGEMIKFFCFNE